MVQKTKASGHDLCLDSHSAREVGWAALHGPHQDSPSVQPTSQGYCENTEEEGGSPFGENSWREVPELNENRWPSLANSLD